MKELCKIDKLEPSLGANLSIQLNYIRNNLNTFSANFGNCSEEQGEQFNQDLKDGRKV